MLFLAIETSSSRGSLALLDSEQCVGETLFPEGLVHGREITARGDALLRSAGFGPRNLDGVAVSIGPGSYTGCRVGVTAAKTLGFALRVPVLAVSSLEVLAATLFHTVANAADAGEGDTAPAANPASVVPLLDGRRGFLYAARFVPEGPGPAGLRRPPTREAPDQVGLGDAVRPLLAPGTWISGSGADLFLASLGSDPLRDDLVRAPSDVDRPRARVLGALARDALNSAGFDLEAIHQLQPAYLRPSEPEIVWAEKARRGASEGKER